METIKEQIPIAGIPSIPIKTNDPPLIPKKRPFSETLPDLSSTLQRCGRTAEVSFGRNRFSRRHVRRAEDMRLCSANCAHL